MKSSSKRYRSHGDTYLDCIQEQTYASGTKFHGPGSLVVSAVRHQSFHVARSKRFCVILSVSNPHVVLCLRRYFRSFPCDQTVFYVQLQEPAKLMPSTPWASLPFYHSCCIVDSPVSPVSSSKKNPTSCCETRTLPSSSVRSLMTTIVWQTICSFFPVPASVPNLWVQELSTCATKTRRLGREY